MFSNICIVFEAICGQHFRVNAFQMMKSWQECMEPVVTVMLEMRICKSSSAKLLIRYDSVTNGIHTENFRCFELIKLKPKIEHTQAQYQRESEIEMPLASIAHSLNM